jgi:DNA invertase Pin-like site-specific DNA recombinase
LLSRGPKALTPDKISKAKDMLRDPTISVATIAETLGVSRATIYSYLPEARMQANANAWNKHSPSLPAI